MQCKVPTCIAFVIADYASVFEVAALACTCRWLRSVFSTRHDALYWPRLQRFSFVRVAATKATASTSPNAAQTQQRQLQPLSDGATERLQCLLGLLRTVRHVHIACEQLTGACLRALCESASDTLRTLRLERAVSMTMPDLLQSVQSCNHLQHLYVSNLWVRAIEFALCFACCALMGCFCQQEAHDDDVFTCTSSKSADEFDEPVYARYKGGRNLFSSHVMHSQCFAVLQTQACVLVSLCYRCLRIIVCRLWNGTKTLLVPARWVTKTESGTRAYPALSSCADHRSSGASVNTKYMNLRKPSLDVGRVLIASWSSNTFSLECTSAKSRNCCRNARHCYFAMSTKMSSGGAPAR